jgi:hypothetical protein
MILKTGELARMIHESKGLMDYDLENIRVIPPADCIPIKELPLSNREIVAMGSGWQGQA